MRCARPFTDIRARKPLRICPSSTIVPEAGYLSVVVDAERVDLRAAMRGPMGPCLERNGANVNNDRGEAMADKPALVIATISQRAGKSSSARGRLPPVHGLSDTGAEVPGHQLGLPH